MNRQLREYLAAEASDRAQSYPVFVERALGDGMRAYWRRISLVTVAALTVVVVLLAVAVSLPRWGRGSVASENIVGLVIEPAEARLALAGTVRFSAVAHSGEGVSHSLDGRIAWESLDTGIATIDGSGLATAISPGTAIISGSAEGWLTEVSLTVLPEDVVAVSIIVNPMSQAVQLGSSQQFEALAQFSDGSTQDISAAALWASTDPSIASVSPNGLASTQGRGQTIITAEWNGLRGSSSLSIIDAQGPSMQIVVDSAGAG